MKKSHYTELPPDRQAEYSLLLLAEVEHHKMGIEINYPLTQALQDALERLQLTDWVRLIDITSLHFIKGKIFRIFRIMPDAVAWMESIERPTEDERLAIHEQWLG